MQHDLQWLQIALLGLAILLALGFVSYFRESLETVLAQAFAVFYRPLQEIQMRVAGFVRSIQQWLRDQMALENETDSRHVIYRIVGSIILSVLFVLFLYCDLGMVVLTLDSLGMGHIVAGLPADPLWATAGAIILSAVLWGIMFFDSIGLTHLTAWHERLAERGRKAFAAFSVLMALVTIVVLAGALPYLRALALHSSFQQENAALSAPVDLSSLSIGFQDEAAKPSASNAEPQGQDSIDTSGIPSFRLIFLTLGCIALLSCVGSLVSMCGFVTGIKYLMLALAFVMSLPVALLAFLIWLPMVLIDGLYNLIIALLTAISNFGRPLLKLARINQPAQERAVGSGPSATASRESSSQSTSQTEATHNSETPGQRPGATADQAEDVHFDPFRF